MTLNPYFNNYTYVPTQNLQQDLTDEIIRMNGIDVYYVPRTFVNLDYLFGEDRDSIFQNAYLIEMYPEDFQGFGGGQELITRFGLQIPDTMNFRVSKRRWINEVGTNLNLLKPNEGDIIFFPLTQHVFQINYAEDEVPFYQFGAKTTFKLQTSLMEYSQEIFDTAIPGINAVEEDYKNEDDTASDPFANNDEIQTESDEYKSTEERNPFGDY